MSPLQPAVALLVILLPALTAVRAAGQEAAGEERLEVRSFVIAGIESIDESALRKTLVTQQRSWLPWKPPRYFYREQFDRDLQRIVSFYADRGFPAARIVSQSVDVNRERHEVDLRAVVDEGQPIRVAGVELEQFDALPDDVRTVLAGLLPLEPGHPLDVDVVQRSRQAAIQALKDHGYPFADVRVDRRDTATGVIVVFRAESGPLSFFGPVRITGNAHVSDGLIRRELRYRPGERFSASSIRESLRRLEALELFRSVDITLAPPAAAGSNDVPMTISVVERNPNRFQVSAGFGSDERLDGEVAWRHVNFFGGGRKAGARGRLSWLDRGGEATLLQPHFVTPGSSFGARGEAWIVDEPARWWETRGGQASVVHALGPRMTVGGTFSLRFQRSRIAGEGLADASLRQELVALGLDPDTGEQSGRLSELAMHTDVTSVDDLLNPRRGYAMSVRVELAGGWLPGRYRYVGVSGEVRRYVALRDMATLVTRARYGAVDPFGPASDVPYFKRFFLGGESSLRGWEHATVAPLSATGLPVGGNSMFEANAELRAAVGSRLQIVGFVDAGGAWRLAWTTRFDDVLYDIGPGIRVSTPFGLIRMDLAYQLERFEGLRINGDRQNGRWRIQIGVGQPF